MEVFYDKPSLALVASVIRLIGPELILTHSPEDYMEDHQNVCRLVVTAAFARSMPYFMTTPARAPYESPVRIYHAPPHGLHDSQGNLVHPDLLVNIAKVLPLKEQMLAAHRSQKDWLEATQGFGAYISEMVELSRQQAERLGEMSHAEGWRRHSHLGYCASEFDPLTSLLGSFVQRLNCKPRPV